MQTPTALGKRPLLQGVGTTVEHRPACWTPEERLKAMEAMKIPFTKPTPDQSSLRPCAKPPSASGKPAGKKFVFIFGMMAAAGLGLSRLEREESERQLKSLEGVYLGGQPIERDAVLHAKGVAATTVNFPAVLDRGKQLRSCGSTNPDQQHPPAIPMPEVADLAAASGNPTRVYQEISCDGRGSIMADLATHLGDRRKGSAVFCHGVAQQNRHVDGRFREGEMGAIVQVNGQSAYFIDGENVTVCIVRWPGDWMVFDAHWAEGGRRVFIDNGTLHSPVRSSEQAASKHGVVCVGAELSDFFAAPPAAATATATAAEPANRFTFELSPKQAERWAQTLFRPPTHGYTVMLLTFEPPQGNVLIDQLAGSFSKVLLSLKSNLKVTTQSEADVDAALSVSSMAKFFSKCLLHGLLIPSQGNHNHSSAAQRERRQGPGPFKEVLCEDCGVIVQVAQNVRDGEVKGWRTISSYNHGRYLSKNHPQYNELKQRCLFNMRNAHAVAAERAAAEARAL